ncbi:MAG: Mini-ribonuclease 3 [Lachnospiraceae bacterium]
MEKGLDYLLTLFGIEETDIRTYSPLTLAYIGDAAYEIVIRTILVEQGNCSVNHLHKRASRLVKASAQSEMAQYLMEAFTPEELAVYKRGRNAHSVTIAKHAKMSDYRRATGFEAVMGYLFLAKEWGRMLELIKIGLEEKEHGRAD